MSTRSNICLLDKESKTISKIYCHWNGYPEYVGSILNEEYQDKEKIKELINLGNISILGKEVSPRKGTIHTFENPQEDITIAYIRDRGESIEHNQKQVLSYKQFANFLRNSDWIEYIYLYVDDCKKWLFWKTYDTKKVDNEMLKELTINLKKYMEKIENE